MPIIGTPLDSGPPADLITLAEAQAALSELALNAAQLAFLPLAITAASDAVRRYCGDRDFVQRQYDRIFPIGLDGTVSLPQIPVLKVSRVAAGRTPALTIANGDRAGNQRATVEFQCEGDEALGITYSGITLTTVSSAVATATSLAFPDYPTLDALATAIDALGAGWSARVAGDFGPWATSELIAGDETAQDAFEGADLAVWGRDLAGVKVRKATGLLDVTRGRLLGVDGPRWGPGWELFAGEDREEDSRVRVVYTAGFLAVPPMIRKATALTVGHLLSSLRTDPRLASESDGAYSYTLESALIGFALPPEAASYCWPHVIHHA